MSAGAAAPKLNPPEACTGAAESPAPGEESARAEEADPKLNPAAVAVAVGAGVDPLKPNPPAVGAAPEKPPKPPVAVEVAPNDVGFSPSAPRFPPPPPLLVVVTAPKPPELLPDGAAPKLNPLPEPAVGPDAVEFSVVVPNEKIAAGALPLDELKEKPPAAGADVLPLAPELKAIVKSLVFYKFRHLHEASYWRDPVTCCIISMDQWIICDVACTYRY